jgi:type IV pilus assembly protein PilE
MKLPSQRGFTMVELMAVVAIIGILAAVAMPSYTRYVVRGNRAAAQQYLLDLATREQQFLADARAYKYSEADLNMTRPAQVDKFYDISFAPPAASPPPTFKITATPKAGTGQVSDGAISIDQTGAKLPTDKW